MPKNQTINFKDFSKIDMRIGTIKTAKVFKEAIKPAYVMSIDFGEFGMKKTSAQITDAYQPEDLIGKQVVAVLNFPPKQISNIMSECLLLGAVEDENKVIIIQPEQAVKNGTKIS